MHCREATPTTSAVKRGNSWACRACNQARVAVSQAYRTKGQSHLWAKMSKTERNSEILKNKGKNCGRGKKFPVEISEHVSS